MDTLLYMFYVPIIVTFFLIYWIRGIYLNSEKIRKILEKEAEIKGIDIDNLYKQSNNNGHSFYRREPK
jgi:uncharacterized membrane protein YcaP (DUF421 family)